MDQTDYLGGESRDNPPDESEDSLKKYKLIFLHMIYFAYKKRILDDRKQYLGGRGPPRPNQSWGRRAAAPTLVMSLHENINTYIIHSNVFRTLRQQRSTGTNTYTYYAYTVI